jgi:hypothetical protein
MEFKDVETPRVFVADDSLPQRKLQKRRLTELTPKGATSSFLISAGLHYFISQLIIYCTLSCLNVKYICVSLVIYLFLCSLFFFLFLPKFSLLYSTMWPSLFSGSCISELQQYIFQGISNPKFWSIDRSLIIDWVLVNL